MRSSVFDGFQAAAAQHPDRPAIVHNGHTISYRALRDAVRARLVRLGPRPGVVAVAATPTPATVVDLLAVWAAGGAYCPVDPAFPPARRQQMLAAAGCRTTTDDRLGTPDPNAADPDPDLAYTLFTSGSTGVPKPVLTPHRAIAAVTGSLRELFDITADDRVLQFASLNWDTCFEEILPTLCSGAALILDDDAHRGSLPHFLRLVARERISVIDLPTAFWHELVHHLADDPATDPLPACLRLVIIGGEAASPARVADWRGLSTGRIRLLNTYGCTETTLITHAVDLHGPHAEIDPPAAGLAAVPIGRPLPHVRQRITDEGELMIGGPAVALGYRCLPEATAARFTDDGFFRTGDRVSVHPDGLLRHEGRIDAEIKIRGVRVDPAEVEAHIAAHPGVSAVAVTGMRVADHTVLVAHVVARPAASTAGLDTSIAEYLRGRVPTHLIPSRIRVVADLVYTASGKVDRQRIKEAMA